MSHLSDKVYRHLKGEIFDFRLLPGDRFSENEVATQVGVSRTPVREALLRLEREGYIQVAAKSGWSVRPFDFELYENLYDLRVTLELAAVRKLCEAPQAADLEELRAIWLVPTEQRLTDDHEVAHLDERFHATLVAAAGNPEMARVHQEVTERIRIIRRLDFTRPQRIECTYQEHGEILRAVLRRQVNHASLLLKSHIEASRAEVRKITLHMLHSRRAG